MPAYQRLEVAEVGDVTVVRFRNRRITEDIDIQELGTEMFNLVEADKRGKLLLNFSAVEFLGSAALGKLITLDRKVKAQGGVLKLSNIGPNIYEVFAITRLNRFFDIKEDEADALAAFELLGRAMTDRWVWLYDRVIASDTKAARQVLDEMLAQLEAQHWQQRDIFAVHLAAEEALVNAIYHGNESDEAKRVHVVCRLSGDRIRIEISDEGGGFNPAALPDPTTNDQLHLACGRGVMLMKAFMSRVEFNEQGNAVVMEKDRNPVAG